MPFARLVLDEKVVIEQIDFVPSAGQIVVSPGDKVRYVVLDEKPEIHHIPTGGGLPGKWMNVVKVGLEKAGPQAKPLST